MNVENLRLGKQGYKHDERTLAIAKFLTPEIHVPARYNFDAKRRAFPDRVWGNDQYGNCVDAARANSQLRLERIEQKRTVPITDEDVIELYKQMTGCKSPGDENDTGLVMLDAMKQWKNSGWRIQKTPGRNYTIAAYGEIDPLNDEQLRAAIYLLGGVHLGFDLPVAAQRMTNEGFWNYSGESTSDFKPGTWGGHAVYAFGYDENSLTIKTWGMNVKVSNSFMHKYCDEAWAVVDNLDSWRTKATIDVAALTAELRQITTRVNQ